MNYYANLIDNMLNYAPIVRAYNKYVVQSTKEKYKDESTKK